MKNIAIYPGSFDPITYGHLDIIKRAIKIFDKVIVAVAHNSEKDPLFSVSERVELLKKATRDIKGVEIDDFHGLVVDYVKTKKSKVVIRGLRMISDFEFEFQMALTNRNLDPNIETVFMMTKADYAYMSSRFLKEIARLGGDVRGFVPPNVAKKLIKLFKVKSFK